MTALAEPTRGELPPTAAYPRREWQWLPADRNYLDGRDGTLVIQITEGIRKPETTFFWYAVQFVWHECDPENGVWSFLLEKEQEPDADGPIACVVGGMVDACGCQAGYFDRTRREPTSCKHRDSLTDLIHKGAMA